MGEILGKKGINVRHSLLELNWHLPVAMEWALNLKTFLVRTLDQFDISTYGLTFGISEYNRDGHYFTSIVVEKNELPAALESIKIRDTYNVLFAKNFDPNTREYIVHSQDIDKLELPTILIELSRKYFEELGNSVRNQRKTSRKRRNRNWIFTNVRNVCRYIIQSMEMKVRGFQKVFYLRIWLKAIAVLYVKHRRVILRFWRL